MSSDQLLNGEAGAEAQANEVMRLVDVDLQEALREIALVAGNDRTVAGMSYPFIYIGEGVAA